MSDLRYLGSIEKKHVWKHMGTGKLVYNYSGKLTDTVCFEKHPVEVRRALRLDHNDEPITYLSRSEGKYRIIDHSLPICSDQDTAEDAMRAAARFVGLKVSIQFWDGDAGQWKNRMDEGL